MQSRDKSSPVALLLAKLRPGVADGRSPDLVKMVAAFDRAEAAARLALDAQARLLLVSYRVGDATSPSKGASDVRRSTLVALIESRKPSETHVSTSTWIIQSRLMAARLVDLLSEPIDQDHDFISVARVGSDRAKFGNAHLKP
ncbi:MAG: hypothetical protein ACRYG8_14840 [Janthinobacterium lividum]